MVFEGRLLKKADTTMVFGYPLKESADSTMVFKDRLLKNADTTMVFGYPLKENADSTMVFTMVFRGRLLKMLTVPWFLDTPLKKMLTVHWFSEAGS